MHQSTNSETVNPATYVPQFTYTDEPFPDILPYDGSLDIGIWKYKVQRIVAVETGRRSKMLLARDSNGRPLYCLTNSGSLKRTRELSKSRRRRVLERDNHACQWCGSRKFLEVDHVVRYIDGGSDEFDNLRTLCHACHASRGGRA